MSIEVDTARNILECAKKTGDRDYFAEYEITTDLVEEQLIIAGFPEDKDEELKKYAVDLAAISVFKHKIGCEESTTMSDCFKIFMGAGKNDSGISECAASGTGTITDLSWNQTLEQVISMLK